MTHASGACSATLETSYGEGQAAHWRLSSPVFPLLVFAVLAIAIAAVGLLGFDQYRRYLTHAVQQDLMSVTDAKLGEFSGWLDERKRDTEALTNDQSFRDTFARWMKIGAMRDGGHSHLRARLLAMRDAYGYEDILLYDRTQRLVLTTNPEALPPTSSGMNLLERVLREGRAENSDIHYLMQDGREHVRLSIVVPIRPAGEDSAAPIGAALLRTDPTKELFASIRAWPRQTQSGETFLAKHEGDSLVYLTTLRSPKAGGVATRFSVEQEKLLAAQVARGREGVLDGEDYRGVAVFGAGRLVPGTSWMVVSKIDKDEVYAPLLRTAWIVGVVTFLFIAGAGVATMLWWRNQRNTLLAGMYKIRLAHESSRLRLASITKYANDVIFLSDANGQIIEANDRAVEVYGYAAEELRGMHASMLRDPGTLNDYEGDINRWSTEGVVYKTVHRSRGGRAIPVEVSARIIELDGRRYRQSIIRDISERIRAETELRSSEARLRSIFDNATTGIAATDSAGRFIKFNEAFRAMLCHDAAVLLGMTLAEITVAEDFASESKLIGEVLAGQRESYRIEKRCITAHGSRIWVSVSASAIRTAEGDLESLVAVVTDISSRRQAREEMRLFAGAFEHSNEGMLVTDAANRIMAVNPMYSRITGYTLDELRGKDPRMLASGQTPRAVYADMWSKLLCGGFWQGEVLNRFKDGSIHPVWLSLSVVRDGDGKLTHHVANFIDISERKEAEARISHLAHHDALTGLLNRVSLQNQLDQSLATARRQGCGLAVIFVDLDNFKMINDTLGHAVGDTILIEVASRLRESVRDSDIVGRLGGDEFVLVLTEFKDTGDAGRVAEKILRRLGQPYINTGSTLHSTPSIGIAMFPADGGDSETLMKNADTAMYHAKAQGRNNLQFFTDEMNVANTARLEMEQDLRVALEQGQFELHYQPKVSCHDGHGVGVEALIRWQHPQKGMISPIQFIGVAEETGLIVPIGAWVLDRACGQLRQWRDLGLEYVTMAINLSARQLSSPSLVTTVAEALVKYGLSGADIELEVTESVAMDDPEKSIEKLGALQRLGVQLSIDDFGTGYSSLAYLKLLPIQQLKLDRSFVRDIGKDANDSAICAATIALAHNLGLKVVAEGVETDEQREFLTAHRCDYLQGYFFSRPVSASAALRFLTQSNSANAGQLPPIDDFPIDAVPASPLV